MSKKILITLDTNLLHEYWKTRLKVDVVRKLISLSKSGKIDLVVTARVRDDIPRDPLAKKLDNLGELGISEIGAVIRFGSWVLGRDFFASDQFSEFYEDIEDYCAQQNIKAPDWRDLDHIQSHFCLGRDIFITWDEAILSLADLLKEKFGVIIKKPEDFLQEYFNEK